jgi:two-component system sensor histidine kinase UhpB
MNDMQLDPQAQRSLRKLQARIEAMVRGDFSSVGEPLGAAQSLEDLRRAIDVLAMHTEQGLKRQHAYIAALTTAQEAERGRLARELHDEIVQQLIALGHATERVRTLVERDPQAAIERLSQLRSDVTATVNDVRRIVGDLRPPALEELGLLPAVELLLQRNNATNIDVALVQQGDERRLGFESELALFRIIQEAWTNIRLHAQAHSADFSFHYHENGLQVTIVDDGLGIAALDERQDLSDHWGIQGMLERAELAGGSLQISSSPGQGTRIEVAIPYPGEGGVDPVCGMSVSPSDRGTSYHGKLYRFCSDACRELFLAKPESYLPSRSA